jgi:hypothetical protein
VGTAGAKDQSTLPGQTDYNAVVAGQQQHGA